MFTVNQSNSPTELNAIIQLRYQMLRQPWHQPIETATDELEENSINAYILDNHQQVVACGRLQENENKVGQIRYMAVRSDFQGKGLGKLIVMFLEEKAKKLGLQQIELQARENAVKFYESRNYTIKEKTFLLWGIIQHYLMFKKLDSYK